MSSSGQPSIEERQRTLRAVASALNIVLPDDGWRSLVSASPRGLGSQARYFPNQHLLIVVKGLEQGKDYGTIARRLLDDALAKISGPAGQDCRAALVSWVGADGCTPAVAFDLAAADGPTILGTSWQPRHLWPQPMPDPDQPPELALHEAIKLVATEVNRLLSSGRLKDRAGILGALNLCEQCFVLAKGIAPATTRSLPSDPGQLPTWLEAFMQAADAEHGRLFSKRDFRKCLPLESSSSSGVLSGVRVFLSYAMPTNVQFARPIMRALELQGAKVWFDQSARPDEPDLEEGLRAVIAEQHVFLFCASRELFENAGYALQELAWVLELQENKAWAGRTCVALLDDVLLPRALKSVISSDLSPIDPELWPAAVVDLVTQAQVLPTQGSDRAAMRTRETSTTAEFDLEALRSRYHHVTAWWNLDENSMVHSVTANPLRSTSLPEFGVLNGLIGHLGWDGNLATYDSWPLDPMLRDMRLRLGVLRCLFFVTAMDLGPEGDVSKLKADMDFLTEHCLPLSDASTVSGWDDEERRFAIRHHLGFLSLLAEVLQRGLSTGLIINYSLEQRHHWEQLIAERRRDCADCLLELRREGRVRWDRDRGVRWDAACRAFDRFLYQGTDQWAGAVPSWVQLALGGARVDASAVFADVVWRSSRSGTPSRRTLAIPSGDGMVQMEIVAIPCGGKSTQSHSGSGRCFGICASLNSDGTADINLSWANEGGQPSSTGGQALASQPLQLIR